MGQKISVIVPVYKVEKYLKRCVESILGQTYNNIEVILVDDGSPDGCPQICDDYAQRDNRVRVIHKTNGGLSSARNAALDLDLTGDYLTFVDSDDWIAKDYLEHGLGLLEQTGADIIQVDFTFVNDRKVFKKEPRKEKIEIFEGKEILQYYLTSTTITGSYSVCRCLFPVSFTRSIRFREGKINEDIDWKYKVLQKAQKLVVTNRIMYYYYQSGNSISSGGLKSKDFQLREAAELLRNLTAHENYGTIAFLGKVKEARTAFSLLSKIAYYGIADSSIDKTDTVKRLTIEHKQNVKTLLKSPMPMNRKILAVLFAMSFSFTERLIQLVKRFTTFV